MYVEKYAGGQSGRDEWNELFNSLLLKHLPIWIKLLDHPLFLHMFDIL